MEVMRWINVWMKSVVGNDSCIPLFRVFNFASQRSVNTHTQFSRSGQIGMRLYSTQANREWKFATQDSNFAWYLFSAPHTSSPHRSPSIPCLFM